MRNDEDDDLLDDLAEQDDDEHEHEPDYCARCRYAGRCAGFCSVPPELTIF